MPRDNPALGPFDCTVCHETFGPGRPPYVLGQCGHSFCGQCLRNQVNANQFQRDIRCALCQAHSTKAVLNHVVAQHLECIVQGQNHQILPAGQPVAAPRNLMMLDEDLVGFRPIRRGYQGSDVMLWLRFFITMMLSLASFIMVIFAYVSLVNVGATVNALHLLVLAKVNGTIV